MIVDGFFEWQRRDKAKQPFLVRRRDGKPFALAGIWEPATTAHSAANDACAVITADAIGTVAELHDRMPVIVPSASYARWLDPNGTGLAELLRPTAEDLVAYPVSPRVNSPANDDPRCIEPMEEGAGPTGSLWLF